MSLVLEKLVVTAGVDRPRLEARPAGARLEVVVVFTSATATMGALQAASVLAQNLDARVMLLVAQIVPFPLPLTSPPVLIDFNERRFGEIAHANPMETAVSIYLCRNRLETLRAVLKPRSLVVIGGRRYWWPTVEQRLARKLRGDGHEVVFAEIPSRIKRRS